MTSTVKYSTEKTILHIVAFFALFLAGDFLSTLFFDLCFAWASLPSFFMYVMRSLGNLVLTFVFYRLYVKRVLKRSFGDFRISMAISPKCALCAVALPAFVVAAFCFAGDFSLNPELSSSDKAGIFLDAAARAVRAGILEEMLFRGFIMTLIEKRWNKAAAILIPSFVFSLVHIPSMETITFGGVALLAVSGTLVGVMFSLLTLNSGSISGSALVHALWNFTIVTDVLCFAPSGGGYNGAFAMVTLPTENILVTGGGFGVESSVIAIAGYALVCLWMALIMKKSPAQRLER